MLAINAGKHVVCEKPLACSLVDAEEMYAAAEEKKVLLLEGARTEVKKLYVCSPNLLCCLPSLRHVDPIFPGR